jgi:hypothetical protein
MDAHERVFTRCRITDNEHTVHGHGRCQHGKQPLSALPAQIACEFFDFSEFRAAYRREPLRVDVQLTEFDWQGDRTQNVDRDFAVAGRFIQRYFATARIDADQFAGIDEALANGRIEISKHGIACQ